MWGIDDGNRLFLIRPSEQLFWTHSQARADSDSVDRRLVIPIGGSVHGDVVIQLDSSQISSLSSAIGEPFSVSWDSFVQIVLDTTVEAYLQMRASGAVNTAMEEDAFSAILTEDYIRPLLRSRQSLNIVAECQAPVVHARNEDRYDEHKVCEVDRH